MLSEHMSSVFFHPHDITTLSSLFVMVFFWLTCAHRLMRGQNCTTAANCGNFGCCQQQRTWVKTSRFYTKHSLLPYIPYTIQMAKTRQPTCHRQQTEVEAASNSAVVCQLVTSLSVCPSDSRIVSVTLSVCQSVSQSVYILVYVSGSVMHLAAKHCNLSTLWYRIKIQ